MRAVVQRVNDASVVVAGEVAGSIGRGLLVYLGVEDGDSPDAARYIADKIRYLRIFPDSDKPMNRDVVESGGAVLVVSAFTTAGDARRGRRPSFATAAHPKAAEPLYLQVCSLLSDYGLKVETGRFREMMEVRSTNDGPICVLLDSDRVF